jgi:hypothetical protein
MFGFTDFTEYRRNEQDLNRRTEQTRVAREQKETARRQAAERRTTERTVRTKGVDAVRPRVA